MINYKIMPSKKSIHSDWVVLLHGLGGSSNIWYKQWDFLKEHFNLILVDFYGHGDTKECLEEYDFKSVASSIIEVLDYLNIKKAHFMGISLGSLIGLAIGYYYPNRVKTLVLGGAILKFTPVTTFLLYLSYLLKNLMPYMWLYRLFALIIMPKKNHKKSRFVFVREAKKLGRHEFLKWHKLVAGYMDVCNEFSSKVYGTIPKLFISGEEDHLFVKDIQKYAESDPSSRLHIIKRCGHVCNVEKAEEFNNVALEYLTEMTGKKTDLRPHLEDYNNEFVSIPSY